MGLSPLPILPDPKIPDEPLPLYAGPILEAQQRARFWTRLMLAASLATAAVALGLALTGRAPWLYVFPFFLMPYLPIAADTRLTELDRKVKEQVRDTLIQRAAAADEEDA